jgi:heme-degrading monooxygenase HmoA
MWAQLISTRIKPGHEGELARLFETLHAAEQPDSGLLHTFGVQDQRDPTRAFVFVVFESEEKARARENDPRRAEGLVAARAVMAEIFDGPPEFVDLAVVHVA